MRGPNERDEDPEVRAERRERDRYAGREDTEYDPTRLFGAPVIVERWVCTDCSALVEMTREAIDLHAMFNRQLAARGERPLAKRIPCARCKARGEELERARRRPHEQRAIPLDNPNRRHHP
jgi:hypothetical protein